MRKVTSTICGAFMARRAMHIGNSHTDGMTLFLHGNAIAQHREDGLYVTNARWSTNTTKERLNGLPGVSVRQKNYQWFLNDVAWDGSWKKVA